MINLIAHLADWVWLVPALPLFALIFIGSRILLGRATGDAAEPLTASLASLAALGSFLLLLGIDGMALWHGTVPGYRVNGIWFASGHWQGTISFLLDGLSLSVSTLTALIGWLVIRFQPITFTAKPVSTAFSLCSASFWPASSSSCWPATGYWPLSAGKCAASPPSCSSATPGSAR
jgi:hypothetical protein